MAAADFMISDQGVEVVLARMTEHDLLEVVEIEQSSGLSPWGWDAYHKELQSPEDVLMLTARTPHSPDTIAGFFVSRLLAGELHVYNVAVREELRGKGIATRLIEAGLSWGCAKGARVAFLEVREGNVAAQRLYSRCGFEITGRRKNYYIAPVEDALLMAVSLDFKP